MKIGDMVKAAYVRGGVAGIDHTGIVVDIDGPLVPADMFRAKYAIVERSKYIRVLANNTVMTFDLNEDKIKVINESR